MPGPYFVELLGKDEEVWPLGGNVSLGAGFEVSIPFPVSSLCLPPVDPENELPAAVPALACLPACLLSRFLS